MIRSERKQHLRRTFRGHIEEFADEMKSEMEEEALKAARDAAAGIDGSDDDLDDSPPTQQRSAGPRDSPRHFLSQFSSRCLSSQHQSDPLLAIGAAACWGWRPGIAKPAASTNDPTACVFEKLPKPPQQLQEQVPLPFSASLLRNSRCAKVTDVISLGTGRLVDESGSDLKSDPINDALSMVSKVTGSETVVAVHRLWRNSPLNSDAIASQFEAVHTPHLDNYVRVQPRISTALELDDYNLTAIETARADTRAWMETERGSAIIQQAVDVLMHAKGAVVLSLDGGGIGGFVQLELVVKLMQMTGRSLTEDVFLMCGTSIGGTAVAILAHGGPRAIVKAERVLFRLVALFAGRNLPYDIDRVVQGGRVARARH